jgi:hypothetical protein
VYVGQIGHTIQARCKEHACHICLYQVDKFAVAEHSTETGHKITFDEITTSQDHRVYRPPPEGGHCTPTFSTEIMGSC